MAERRMFTKKIIDSDAFLDMPLSTQSLYFHLNMRADDDGFLNNPKKIQRMIGASDDDLKLLFAKRFVLAFDNGVVVIKHWRMHNLIRKDRYSPTQYTEERDTLTVKSDGSYTERTDDDLLPPPWQPDDNQYDNQSGNQAATQYREEEDRSEEGYNSFIHSREEAKMKYLGGSLGKGVVLLSEEQIDMLLTELSLEEFDKYVAIVADMELSGKHYKKKTHYQAILDMAAKDRRTRA